VDLITVSARMEIVTKLYKFVRRKYPTEKIIFFSASLRFLDILAEALERDNISPLRYDGIVSQDDRKQVEREFKTCDAATPLLVTIGAGKFLSPVETRLLIRITRWGWPEFTRRKHRGYPRAPVEREYRETGYISGI
jgi:hypothetical protein